MPRRHQGHPSIGGPSAVLQSTLPPPSDNACGSDLCLVYQFLPGAPSWLTRTRESDRLGSQTWLTKCPLPHGLGQQGAHDTHPQGGVPPNEWVTAQAPWPRVGREVAGEDPHLGRGGGTPIPSEGMLHPATWDPGGKGEGGKRLGAGCLGLLRNGIGRGRLGAGCLSASAAGSPSPLPPPALTPGRHYRQRAQAVRLPHRSRGKTLA